MKSFTGLSFIIPHRESDDISSVVDNIHKSLKNQKIKYEIISVVGNHPTYQRNHAAKASQYSHLYFLDDDAEVNHKSISTLIEILKSDLWEGEKISLVGGPTLLKQPASYLENCVNATLTSKIVVGKIRARYSQVGQPRFSNDQELILCNLIIKKDHFNQLDKFNTNLYPNEENDFIYRLIFARKENQQLESELGRVLYHPDIFVNRPQRKTFKDFIKQMITYGRGRAEQTKNSFRTLHPHLLLAIPFFLIILTMLLALIISLPSQLFNSNLSFGKMLIDNVLNFFLPLVEGFTLSYLLYLFYVMFKESVRNKKWLLFTPALIFSCHFFYGMGMLTGFFQKGFVVDRKKVRYQIKKLT